MSQDQSKRRVRKGDVIGREESLVISGGACRYSYRSRNQIRNHLKGMGDQNVGHCGEKWKEKSRMIT